MNLDVSVYEKNAVEVKIHESYKNDCQLLKTLNKYETALLFLFLFYFNQFEVITR